MSNPLDLRQDRAEASATEAEGRFYTADATDSQWNHFHLLGQVLRYTWPQSQLTRGVVPVRLCETLYRDDAVRSATLPAKERRPLNSSLTQLSFCCCSALYCRFVYRSAHEGCSLDRQTPLSLEPLAKVAVSYFACCLAFQDCLSFLFLNG